MPTTRRQAQQRRLKALGKRPSTAAIADGGVLAAIKIAVYVLGRDAKDGGGEHCVYVLGKRPSTPAIADGGFLAAIKIAVCSHEIYCVCARRSENCVFVLGWDAEHGGNASL